MDNNRLNTKDLINVGIYTAICAVICCIVAMTGIIPIMMVLLVVFVPILTGIPYMLFLTKVKKFGMILILNILMGALMWVTGMSYYALAVGVVSGLAAELIYPADGYKSKWHGIIA